MSAEIERYEGADSWANMLEPVAKVASWIAPTEFVNRAYRGKPASVAAAILAGRELGLGPTTALRVLHVIEGQVSMSADAMLGRVLAAGHQVQWGECTEKVAELRIIRGDGLGEAHVIYTMRDAERSGDANKRNYQKYPRAMLRARAITECVRMVAADILLGLDAAEMVDEPAAVRADGPTTTVQIRKTPEAGPAPHADVEPQPDPTEETPQMVTAKQIRQLNALLDELEQLEGRERIDDQRRDMVIALAGAQGIDSAKQLTTRQASTAIDGLRGLLEIARKPQQE